MGHISFWLTLMMYLLGDNIDTVKKNTDALIDASNEVGSEVCTEETKYILLSRRQNAEQIDDKELF
jgi:hypothetical protein